jgi:TolB-like protein/Flp pilus assembly protein TadD
VTDAGTAPAHAATRRLAAILVADVVGYSRMMARDDSGTHRRVSGLGSDTIGPLARDKGGRVVKTMGDGFLMEFGSVTDAFDAGVAIQRALWGGDADSLRMRIGLHIGDVIVDGADIFGDGVIIAARLEGLAEPGGILVSEDAFTHLRGAQRSGLTALGDVDLKNIARRVAVWQWRDGTPRDPVEPAVKRSRPRVAVTRFRNLSGDADQDYFADGISEDLRAGLTRSRLFDVIASGSSFAFDPAAIDHEGVGRALGARYVVAGSIRKAGERVRISAELVDAGSGREIWSDRFDGELRDIFDLQDRATAALSSAIVPEITRAEIERTRAVRVGSLTAWDHYLQAVPLMQKLTEAANREAVSHLEAALALEPDFSSALALLSRCRVTAAYQLWGEGPEAEHGLAERAARSAVEADPDNALAFDARAAVYVHGRAFDEAILAARRAMELDPGLASAYGALSAALAFSGRAEEALEVCRAADRISPRDPDRSQRQMSIIIAHFAAGNDEAVRAECQHYILVKPNWFGVYTFLAASCAWLGRQAEAEKAVARLLEILPGYTVTLHADRLWLQREEDRARLLDGLRKAGLPD